MVRILLLDCSESPKNKLESQWFNVESGTLGFCTGVRKLPSQVYEKDVFIYNPESCSEGEAPLGKGLLAKSDAIRDLSPEYGQYLEARIAIRRVREEQGINQEEAAERCGLHRTYYRGVERGVRNVSLVNIEKIAKGLKKSLPDLFGRL